MKHRFFLISSWKGILGLMVFAMVIFLAGWEASSALAQSEGGSEPGARTIQTNDTAPDKLALSAPPAKWARMALLS